MNRVISFDRGSKKRIRKIRWTALEKMTFVLLLLFLFVFCIAVGLWDGSSFSG